MYKCNINHESFGALLSDVYYVASGSQRFSKRFPMGLGAIPKGPEIFGEPTTLTTMLRTCQKALAENSPVASVRSCGAKVT